MAWSRKCSDQKRIAAYFDDLVDTYGHDPRAVDVSSYESLEVRYKTLAALTDFTRKSVLEVGCGLGDFGAYLTERFDCDYRGIDISERMIEEGDSNLDLTLCNVMDWDESADIVLAQGIFTQLGDEAEAKTREIVSHMYDLAGEAVGFTAISTWTPEPEPDEYYMDPCFALELGHSLTKFVVLRHDYHLGDLAMYLYRRKPS